MDFLTLSQLNNRLASEVKNAFSETCWVVAETSDVHMSNRHCYLEFIEKNPQTNVIIAKVRGHIWSNVFETLHLHFEQATGRQFSSNLTVLVKVSVDIHPIYGYGLTVYDIDPSYTLGDLQSGRQKILRRLEEEGVLTLNKELEIPPLPQRIAVISSATAAGYEDFLNHLTGNRFGYVFYTRLFPALMQGEQTETSIISALDKIAEYRELFDMVVIIRGGGATSDLVWFDSYLLAANCAQFPLPVITGIGHERDDTVLDFVASYRAKTPTAVADFLIARVEETAAKQIDCQSKITESAQALLKASAVNLRVLTSRIPLLTNAMIENKRSEIEIYRLQMKNLVRQILVAKHSQLKEKESFFRLSSPKYILDKGYSITLKNGKAVKSAKELREGDAIETVLADGRVAGTVKFAQPLPHPRH
ncbi:MAG: exodeoxyribonuclease VII large subunit [Dysgonamonadaceae bacterium]|jgi:exodeoxyribonuclease VII large subunit|nr:exodeoxyribonuclease VII large subunit [Dysgonamonadaceae bacterium]